MSEKRYNVHIHGMTVEAVEDGKIHRHHEVKGISHYGMEYDKMHALNHAAVEFSKLIASYGDEKAKGK